MSGAREECAGCLGIGTGTGLAYPHSCGWEASRYRSLHISDIHMSNSLPHARQTNARGVTDRLADQLKLWRRVYEIAERAHCEAIFVQGDLFDHSRTDAITLAETCHIVAESPLPIYIVPGNHDGVNTRGERFTVEAMSVIECVNYMRTGEPFCPREWLTFWPLEFSPLERTREALRTMKLKRDVTNVLLMHNSIVGCTHCGWTCEEGQGLEARELTDHFDHVLSGHFHDPQPFGRNGRYLGAPMHHRFDDIGRPAGFWVMQWHRSGARKEVFVDGGCPRFHTLAYADKAARRAFRARTGDYVRVVLRCTHAKLVKRQIAVQRYVDELVARGFRAHWVHDPVYHHVARMRDEDGMPSAVLAPRKMVSGYVDAVEVDTNDLDTKALKQLGRDIFVAVEGEWRG